MIPRMDEIVESMFTKDNDSTSTSAPIPVIPTVILHLDPSSSISSMPSLRTAIPSTVLTTEQDIVTTMGSTIVRSSVTSIISSVPTSDTSCTSASRHYNLLLKDLHDPLGILETFIDLSWYDDSYKEKYFEGYEWYLLPPYNKLLLYHDHQINIIPKRKPSAAVYIC